jgi:hypothetical protein
MPVPICEPHDVEDFARACAEGAQRGTGNRLASGQPVDQRFQNRQRP